ncbi:MAG: phosphoribosylamine--glycine ligase [Actinomycetes bacterium]
MRVLVLGSGGREHALAHGLARSDSVDAVLIGPGNPGTATVGTNVAVDPTDGGAVVDLARREAIDLVVIGPEAPLVAGVADALRAVGIPTFGPGADGARLEGSKAWMKEVLAAAGVPTAAHATFGAGEEADALAYLESMPGFYVVKTDGLAAGKGVVVTESIDEGRDAVRSYLSGDAFGDAGRTLVIEEGLTGPEVSLLVVCDGSLEGVALAPAQDFKRIGEGDSGPNTGGMGAYSPVPVATDAIVDEVMERAVIPTLAELSRRGIEYRGVLYAGMMLTPSGPRMLEYNVRFGDPECEVVVPRITSDLGVHLHEAATGRLTTPITFADDAAVTVVVAAEGYPTAPRTGDRIEGLEEAAAIEGVTVFHAGTRAEADAILTAGGRVLTVTGRGPTIAEARSRAYAAVDQLCWPGITFRSDIAATAAH